MDTQAGTVLLSQDHDLLSPSLLCTDPHINKRKGLWEGDSMGKAGGQPPGAGCPVLPSLCRAAAHGEGDLVLLATGGPRTSSPAGLGMDVSCRCPPLVAVLLGLVDGFPEDGVQGQSKAHRLLCLLIRADRWGRGLGASLGASRCGG